MQCKLNTILSQNRVGKFWIKGFIVELWGDLLTSTVVASNSESNEEQIPSTDCLSNDSSPVQQNRW